MVVLVYFIFSIVMSFKAEASDIAVQSVIAMQDNIIDIKVTKDIIGHKFSQNKHLVLPFCLAE